MNFLPDTSFDVPHGWGRCACHPSRRLFTGLMATGAVAPALAQEGVVVKEDSWAMRQAKKVISASEVEKAGAQNFAATVAQARQQGALVPPSHEQSQRLQYIAKRLLPYAPKWNARARDWQWEVQLIASDQVNAFCMPGGKIAFFTGILVKLQLSDDEVAQIMGHEIAHALQEHARERMAQTAATRLGANVVSMVFGLGDMGNLVVGLGAQMSTLKFGRDDESEADLIGLELAARAGYDPRAGVTLWQKMGALQKNAPPQWMSTHPSGPTRIRDLQANQPRVEGLFARAEKPDRRFPAATARG